MRKYIVYNSKGKILRYGQCTDTDFEQQLQNQDEFIMEGVASDYWNKIVDGKVVNKTPEEIDADNPQPEPVSFKQRRASITNEQYQNILNRLERLENKK